jgi:hypothetical protein
LQTSSRKSNFQLFDRGTQMARDAAKRNQSIGRYVWRDDSGKLRGVDIIRPKKGPTSTSVSEIRRAVREVHAARKKK